MDAKIQQLKKLAKERKCSIEESPCLKGYTTFRIGGKAPLLIETGSTAIGDLLALADELCVPVFLIGNGSNLLVSDDGMQSVLIRLKAEEPIVNGNEITCSAGTLVSKLCKAALSESLSGLEFAYGIPGTVGGGVYMNAGAYGGEMRHVLKSVVCVSGQGEKKEISAEELHLGYRKSDLMRSGDVVVSATFSLNKGEKTAIETTMNELLGRRKAKQPLDYPSAGSFFKRPKEDVYAGKLIQDCGLKGFRIGDAMISEKHAGFMINCGNATCKEVKAVAQEVYTRVLRETGYKLRPEVRLIGEDWGF